MSSGWYRLVETFAILILLILFGGFYFSGKTRERRTEIELEAGMEQLYHLESAHFEQTGEYFDPARPGKGPEWDWPKSYRWELHPLPDRRLRFIVRADLDEDGNQGVWMMEGPTGPRLVVED